MSSTLPVIAAVDGSDGSLRTLDRALGDARRRGVPLRVVHVRQYAAGAPDILVAGPLEPGDDPVLDQMRAYLRGRADLPVVGVPAGLRSQGPHRRGPPPARTRSRRMPQRRGSPHPTVSVLPWPDDAEPAVHRNRAHAAPHYDRHRKTVQA
jgi:hypothetical protein